MEVLVLKLTISKSKNSTSLYVAKSMYVNGTRTSKIVEKLGTVAEPMQGLLLKTIESLIVRMNVLLLQHSRSKN